MPLSSILPKFLRGIRLPNGDGLDDLTSEMWSTETGITAAAGGTQAAARKLTEANNVVGTVASAADSVRLPPAQVGRRVLVRNSGANSMQVFGDGSDTINAAATATGVAQAASTSALYWCASVTGGVGAWFRILSA
mgnify:CR=1 FL=1